MTDSRSSTILRRLRWSAACVIVLALGVVPALSSRGSTDFEPTRQPTSDLVNPWAAGDAAVQRLLDSCRQEHRTGSGRQLFGLHGYTGPALGGCQMFPSSRVIGSVAERR